MLSSMSSGMSSSRERMELASLAFRVSMLLSMVGDEIEDKVLLDSDDVSVMVDEELLLRLRHLSESLSRHSFSTSSMVNFERSHEGIDWS